MSNLSQLVPVEEKIFGTTSQQCVSAFNLHSFLKSKQLFANWIQNRIKKYGFVENESYLINLLNRSDGKPGRGRIDYLITIGMAKELCMVENNEKGQQARKYFISCEKKLDKAKEAILDLAKDPIIGMRMAQLKMEEQIKEQNDRLSLVEAKIITKNIEYFTISGFASLHKWNVTHEEAKKYGKIASKLSRERFLKINKEYDAKYGNVNSYKISVLEDTFESTRERKENLHTQIISLMRQVDARIEGMGREE